MTKECSKDLPIEEVIEIIHSFQSDVSITDTGTSYIIKPYKHEDVPDS